MPVAGARDIKKGGSVLCQGVGVKYAFMQAHQEEFSVALMCELFRVSRSGYYARLGRSFPSKRTLENQRYA